MFMEHPGQGRRVEGGYIVSTSDWAAGAGASQGSYPPASMSPPAQFVPAGHPDDRSGAAFFFMLRDPDPNLL